MLVLGAGYVAPSCIECLAREEGLGVTVVSAIEREAEVIAKKFPQCVAYELDVEKSPEELDSLVKNHDVVIRYAKHLKNEYNGNHIGGITISDFDQKTTHGAKKLRVGSVVCENLYVTIELR